MENKNIDICEYKHIFNKDFEKVVSFTKTTYHESKESSFPFENVDWKKYKDYNRGDVYNTFLYLFDRMMKGIYISIRNGKIRKFIPFSNKHYQNDWSHLIKVKNRNIFSFLKSNAEKQGYTFYPKSVNPVHMWRANNYMLRYDKPKSTVIMTGVDVIYDMFSSLCNNRTIPDVDFFVNRRDFPMLTKNNTEPYYDIWGHHHPLPESFQYEKWCPILSMCTSDWNSDIPLPTHDDWTRVCPDKTFFKYEKSIFSGYTFELNWSKKKPIAVFRGGSTGGGVTIDTNPRLKVSYLNSKRMIDPTDGLPFLDAGITKWNIRPRKLYHYEHLCEMNVEDLTHKGIKLLPSLSPREQSMYKYIINIDGHVSAFRLSRELSTGSCILLVESPYRIWYRKMLKPWVHYVPVKKDLSDLIDTIKWCKNNDEKCRQISLNALEFYRKYLSKTSIYDYLESLMNKIHMMYKGKVEPTLWHEQDKYFMTEIKKYQQYHLDFVKPFTHLSPNIPSSCDILDKRSWSRLRAIELLIYTIGIDKYTGRCIHKKKDNTLRECFIGLHCVNRFLKENQHFVYTYGISSNNNNELLVEYIDGITLKDFIHSTSFTMNRFMSILFQVYMSIQYAYETCDFVHMNLSPMNIIIKINSSPKVYTYTYQNKKYILNTDVHSYIINYGNSTCMIDGVLWESHNTYQVKTQRTSSFDYFVLFVTSLWEWFISSSYKKTNNMIQILLQMANFFIPRQKFYIKKDTHKRYKHDLGIGKLYEYIKQNKPYPIMLKYNHTFEFTDLLFILCNNINVIIQNTIPDNSLVNTSLFYYTSFFHDTVSMVPKILPEIPNTLEPTIEKLYILHKIVDIINTFPDLTITLQEMKKTCEYLIQDFNTEKVLVPNNHYDDWNITREYSDVHPCCFYNSNTYTNEFLEKHPYTILKSGKHYYKYKEQVEYLHQIYQNLHVRSPENKMMKRTMSKLFLLCNKKTNHTLI